MFDSVIEIPPFNVRLRSPFSALKRHMEFFYAGYWHRQLEAFVDFDIQVLHGRGLRRWWGPQARFVLDGEELFFPLPADQAAPVFEWGLNWCVANRALGYLVMHAGLMARAGRALMMPGVPGAGKSTLCASLCLLEDWRLLSDELALLDPATGLTVSHPRPISLKNTSIEVVGAFPTARLGQIYWDTRKGSVSHAACPPASVAAASETARVEWIVFPRFEPNRPARLSEVSKAEAFALISEQSFNTERMGQIGFDALCTLLSNAACYQIAYGSTADALSMVRDITNR